MNVNLKVLPFPGVPNRNNVVYTKEALDNAVEKYMELVKEGKALIYTKFPSHEQPDERQLTDVVGSIRSIEFDEEKNCHIATCKILETPVGQTISMGFRDSILSEDTVCLATNKIGKFARPSNDDVKEYWDMETEEDGHILCDDPDLEIRSMTMATSDLVEPIDINNKGETEAETDNGIPDS